MVYKRAIIVGCSENIINIPDQQLLVHFCILLAGRFLLLDFHTFSKLVGVVRTLSIFQTKFHDKLLVHFCTLLAGHFIITPQYFF